jgi:fatty acid desaturase
MATIEKPRLLELHRRRWAQSGAWLCLLALFTIALPALVATLVWGPLWLAPPLVLLVALLMHSHLVAFHEASHGLLVPNRRLNDFLGIVIGLISFMSLSLYRASHRWHHAYLASERDEELWPFAAPGSPRWARRLAAFLELNFGLLYTPALFLRSFLRPGSLIRAPRVRRRIWVELAGIACFWAAQFAVATWLGTWQLLLIAHFVPAFLAANLQSWRKYVEHVGLHGSTPRSATRSVLPHGPLGRLLSFTLLHEPYHGAHHLYAQVPHEALPELAGVLAPAAPGDVAPFPSYRSALRDLVRGLGDPKVGAQWLGERSAKTEEAPAPAFRAAP